MEQGALPLKGREKDIVSETKTATVSEARLGKLLRGVVERIRAFPTAHRPS